MSMKILTCTQNICTGMAVEQKTKSKADFETRVLLRRIKVPVQIS